MITEGITEAVTQRLLAKADVPDCKGIIAYPLEVPFVDIMAEKIAEKEGKDSLEILESINAVNPDERSSFFDKHLASPYSLEENFATVNHMIDADINKIYEENNIPMAQFKDKDAYRRTPEQAEIIREKAEVWAAETFEALFELK